MKIIQTSNPIMELEIIASMVIEGIVHKNRDGNTLRDQDDNVLSPMPCFTYLIEDHNRKYIPLNINVLC